MQQNILLATNLFTFIKMFNWHNRELEIQEIVMGLWVGGTHTQIKKMVFKSAYSSSNVTHRNYQGKDFSYIHLSLYLEDFKVVS